MLAAAHYSVPAPERFEIAGLLCQCPTHYKIRKSAGIAFCCDCDLVVLDPREAPVELSLRALREARRELAELRREVDQVRRELDELRPAVREPQPPRPRLHLVAAASAVS